jgi:methylmalonyl-CoA epimerase
MGHRLHHVALAVKDINTVASFLKELLGAELDEDYSLETNEFLSRMVKLGDIYFELLEPRGKNGLIERFLNTRGEGVHHISIETDNPEEIVSFCEKKGMSLIGKHFIHPKSAHGMLIELVEGGEKWRKMGPMTKH